MKKKLKKTNKQMQTVEFELKRNHGSWATPPSKELPLLPLFSPLGIYSLISHRVWALRQWPVFKSVVNDIISFVLARNAFYILNLRNNPRSWNSIWRPLHPLPVPYYRYRESTLVVCLQLKLYYVYLFRSRNIDQREHRAWSQVLQIGQSVSSFVKIS